MHKFEAPGGTLQGHPGKMWAPSRADDAGVGTRSQHREWMHKFEAPGGTLGGHLGATKAPSRAGDAGQSIGHSAQDWGAPVLKG
jgi:hypothetical protein